MWPVDSQNISALDARTNAGLAGLCTHPPVLGRTGVVRVGRTVFEAS